MMNRNLMKQIKLAKGEKVYYDFKNLKGKSSDCRIVLTTNRIIIYNDQIDHDLSKAYKRNIRKKGINEIQRNTITHIEYFIQYISTTYIAKIIGLILFLAGAMLAILNYTNYAALPALVPGSLQVSTLLILIDDLIYYGAGFIIAIIGLIVMLKKRKSLIFRVVSGHVDDCITHLKKNKYNELAINKISTRLYV